MLETRLLTADSTYIQLYDTEVIYNRLKFVGNIVTIIKLI